MLKTSLYYNYYLSFIDPDYFEWEQLFNEMYEDILKCLYIINFPHKQYEIL